MSTTRLALLFGDDTIVDALAVAAAFGDYAHTFCQLLASSLGPIITEVAFSLDAYDVVYDITFPPDDVRYDGERSAVPVFFVGLASTEDPTPWVIELLDHVKHILAGQPSLKPYGLCFGRQIIVKAPRYFIKQGDWEVSVTKPRSYPYQRRTDSEPHIVSSLALAQAHLAPSKVVYDQGVAIFELTLALLPGNLESGHLESTAPGLYMWISHSAEKLGPVWSRMPCRKTALTK